MAGPVRLAPLLAFVSGGPGDLVGLGVEHGVEDLGHLLGDQPVEFGLEQVLVDLYDVAVGHGCASCFPIAILCLATENRTQDAGHARFNISTKNKTESAQEFGRYRPLPEEAHLDSDDKSTAIITFKEGTTVKLQAKQPNYTISATIDNIANVTNTPLSGFQVADGDGAMHNATATITGNTLRIHSDEVKRIAQIQYLWQSNPNCSSIVYNDSNLPLSPFTLNVNQKTYSH